MKTLQLLFLGMFISILSTSLSATNYYVTIAGNNGNNGLSWSTPTTLDAALALVIDDDVINIGAGTYTPAVWLTGGNAAGDATFEIKKNISIIGGYPTVPTSGAQSSSANITLFNGLQTCNHVVAITAPVVGGKKVSFNSISITGGKSAASGAGIVINAITYNRTYGGGLIVGASNVELNSCRIYENTGNHALGMLAFGAATVVLNNCSIENNIGTGNGIGLWNDGSNVTLNNCSISGNQTSAGNGAGILAINANAKTYMYNTTISNNTAGSRTAYYGREKSVGVMVNCTVSGNTTTSSSGSGICLYTNNNSGNAVKLDIINSTITNNSAIATETSGGIRLNDAYCTLNIYNSIVSGNTVGSVGSKVVGDIALLNSATYSKKNTILTDKVYDVLGALVAGQTFNYATMLGALADNGGLTKTCQLLGSSNPAKSYGMTAAELTTLGNTFTPVIPASTITYDQLNNLRSGTAIGSWTAFRVTNTSNSLTALGLTDSQLQNNEIVIQKGCELVVDKAAIIGSLTVNPAGKLTISSGQSLSAGTLTIQSDATGTGTLKDENTDANPPTIAATVQQYLTSGRNWYVSSPVSGATTANLSSASSIVYYNESTAEWLSPANGAKLDSLKGYISVSTTSSGPVTFNGNLFSGVKTINLTRTPGKAKEGFNLVGNPYPSYLNWTTAIANAANATTTIWYRTRVEGSFTFHTYNAQSGLGVPTGTTGEIPPMQAFWVRANPGGGTLTLNNNMRSHGSASSSLLKAPAALKSDQKVLRLQVSNSSNHDETVVCFNPNASNEYDAYDSPKMSNGNPEIPEIYTTSGTEPLVINGLNNIELNKEIPLVLTLGQSTQFSIKATEISNFDANTKIVLKDKLLNTESDLELENPYSFTSNIVSKSERFSIIFKTISITTDINKPANGKVIVTLNSNNQIVVNSGELADKKGIIRVYNSVGQNIETFPINGAITVIHKSLGAGLYIITVSAEGKNSTNKLSIK